MSRLILLAVCFAAVCAPALRGDDKKPADPPAKQVEKDSFDKLVTDMIGVVKKTTEVLKKAKDAQTAKATKPEVEKLAAEMQGVQKRFEQMAKPTKEQEAELEKKHKQNMDDAVKALQGEVMRLAKADYGKELLDALQPKSKPGGK